MSRNEDDLTAWGSRRVLVVMAVVGALVASVLSPAGATSDKAATGASGVVIEVVPGTSATAVIELMAAIEDLAVGNPGTGDAEPLRFSAHAEAVFEQPLSSGSVWTFGVSAAAVREEGPGAFDLSRMVEDMLPAQVDQALSGRQGSGSDIGDANKIGQAADTGRAELEELRSLVSGTPMVPHRLVVMVDAETDRASVVSLVEQRSGFLIRPDTPIEPASGGVSIQEGPGGVSGLRSAWADDCMYFSPKYGHTTLGYSSTYPGKRFTQSIFAWSQFRIDHIAAHCSVNSTIEIETHTTVTGGHFLGTYYTWASNLPSAYKDVAFGDGDNAVAGYPTKQWTIGSARLRDVQPWYNYNTVMWTYPGASTSDLFMSNSQLGIRIPPGCYSPWCIFPRASYYLASPWTLTPNTKSWYKSDPS